MATLCKLKFLKVRLYRHLQFSHQMLIFLEKKKDSGASWSIKNYVLSKEPVVFTIMLQVVCKLCFSLGLCSKLHSDQNFHYGWFSRINSEEFFLYVNLL